MKKSIKFKKYYSEFQKTSIIVEYYAPGGSFGEAIDTVSVKEDGTMWVGNSEYVTQVNFNPFTGEPASVQLPLEEIIESKTVKE